MFQSLVTWSACWIASYRSNRKSFVPQLSTSFCRRNRTVVSRATSREAVNPPGSIFTGTAIRYY